MLKAPFKFEGSSQVANHTASATPINNQAIPTLTGTDPSGNPTKPKYVAVCHDGSAAGLFIEIVFGQNAATTITAGNGFMVPENEVVVFDVTGFTHYAIVADGADVEVRLTSLGNY